MPRPLICQSKLLCFSVFYLVSSLFFALFASLSPSRCNFSFRPSDQIRHTLYSYPKSYGQHKYAIPTVHSNCSSPVFFRDYALVSKEIRELCENSSNSSPVLKYLSLKGDSFAGYLTMLQRKSFFNLSDVEMAIPCGFARAFPVSDCDRLAMESCRGLVVVSAIFGDHDKIRQPRGLGAKTLDTVCFFLFVDNSTLSTLHSHKIFLVDGKIGAWKIVKVSSEDMPYKNPAMNGVIAKHLIHRLFPNSKFSIWVDAKMQLTADPLLLIHSLVVTEQVDMAISKHPHNVHTMEEAIATARWKKWGSVESLKAQMEVYCDHGLKPWSRLKLPYSTDVPDTALILRKHGVANNLFSCLLFNELEAFNPRDQLAFAFVRDFMNPKIKINFFEVEVFEHISIEYRHSLKRGAESVSTETWSNTNRVSLKSIHSSKCNKYLTEMWRESHD